MNTHTKQKFKRQDRVIAAAMARVNSILETGVDETYSHIQKSETFKEPKLDGLETAMQDFYIHAITEGYHSAVAEKALMTKKKRLAAIPKGKIPSLKALVDLFKDKRLWPSAMKRSKKLTDRLRKSYLGKLRFRFKYLVPEILAGTKTPEEIKNELKLAWKSTKSRVELIFRTETTKYFAETQVTFFQNDEDIIGFLFDSVADSGRTEICRSRHGMVLLPKSKALKLNTPSLHYNCRSHLIALASTNYNRKLMNESLRQPSNRTLAPLPHGWRVA
jgi:SPP1 gp7 family putative phage head morphogenesis protein